MEKPLKPDCIGEMLVSSAEEVIKTMSKYCKNKNIRLDISQGNNPYMGQLSRKCQTINKFQLISKHKRNEIKKIVIEPAIEKYIFSWHMKVQLEKYNYRLLLSGINGQIRIWRSLDNVIGFIIKTLPSIKNLEINLDTKK